MKKILCLMAVMTALSGRAATAVVDGITWTYTVSAGKASVCGGSSSSHAVPTSTSGAITIPSTLGGFPVTSIGQGAFSGCSGLTSVTIPDSVTSIGNNAFSRCSGLTSVTIPGSVTSIGQWAFSGCSGLTSVTIPDSVTSIGENAFSWCEGLTSVTIPGSVTSIGNNAFSSCRGLTSMTIPGSVTSIGSYAFSGCSGLTSVTIPDSVTRIEVGAFSGCSGLTSVTIPDSVTSIGNNAFSSCSGLTSVHISDLAAWQDVFFYDEFSNPCRYAHHLFLNGTEVTDIVVPDGVTSVGQFAFIGCSGLKSVTIPDSVTSVGQGAFYGCSQYTLILRTSALSRQSLMDASLSGTARVYCPRSCRIDVALAVGGMEKIAGYTEETVFQAEIVSAQIRESDPTVMDVTYIAHSDTPTVNVRALAFENGERGFATVVRPETWIDGTDANIGNGIAANVQHRLSWKVSSDWATDLAKVKFEVLAMRPGDLLLPMHFVTIPAAEGHPKTIVSVNDLSAGQIWSPLSSESSFYSRWWSKADILKDEARLNALLWLYAGNETDLTLSGGVLSANGMELIRHAAFDCTLNGVGQRLVKNASEYLFGKMGYRRLQNTDEIAWISENTRHIFNPDAGYGFCQYAVKTVEE